MGQGAYCGVVAFAVSPLVLIEARCPRAGAHRLGGELMEGLAQEFGTNPSEVAPFAFATLLSDSLLLPWIHRRRETESHGRFHQVG